MIKKKNTPQKKKVSKNILDSIPYMQVYQNGMMMVAPGEFSKTYSFEDTNYTLEPEDKKDSILDIFSKLAGKFPPTVTFNIHTFNNKEDLNVILKNVTLKAKGDKLNDYREAYNSIIENKLKEGNNNVKKEHYLTVCIKADSLQDALNTFAVYDREINTYMADINHVGVTPLTIGERLKLIHDIYNQEPRSGITNVMKDLADERDKNDISLEKMHKAGMTSKMLVCPGGIKKSETYLQIGDKFCKSMIITDLPTSLSTDFISSISNVPFSMLTTFTSNTINKKDAIKLVKTQNTDIKTEVGKKQQEYYKAGMDPSLMSDELQFARENAKELLEDITRRNESIFYTSLAVTIFADSLKELERNVEIFKMKVTDHGCQAKVLLGQQLLCLHSVMPFGKKLYHYNRILTREALEGFNPFHMQELMDKDGCYYGVNQETNNLIIINRKSKSGSPHGIITGITRSGKSFITKGEIEFYTFNTDDDIYIIDPDNEYVVLAENYGGQVVNMSSATHIHINPFDININRDEKDKEDPVIEKSDFIVSMVSTMLGSQIILTPFEINVIHKACRNILTPYVDGMKAGLKKMEDAPTLVDFYRELMNMEGGIGRRLAANIEAYCVGNYNLFAHKTNIDPSAHFIVYAIRSVQSNMKELAMQVIMETVFNKAVENHGKKNTRIYVDEFYLLMKKQTTASYLQMLFKRIAKYDGIVTGITQDIEDCLITQEGRGIVSNAGFSIMLNQSAIGRQQLQEIYSISDSLMDYVKDKKSGTGLIYNGSTTVPFDYIIPTDNILYKIMSTKSEV